MELKGKEDEVGGRILDIGRGGLVHYATGDFAFMLRQASFKQIKIGFLPLFHDYPKNRSYMQDMEVRELEIAL